MTQDNKTIYVTKPALPDLSEFVTSLEQIWDSGILTNNGPFHDRFEQALCDMLGVPEIALFANGTLSLVCAMQAMDLTGEVITTPFSFVATAHAIRWLGLTPVFVDVDPVTLNLDPACVEAAITPRTSAILPVHCYGNPCDTQAIQSIATRHGLKVVYDAAHAFGVEDAGGSVLRHGDVSSVSFHATKVFNTFEGGAVICHDAQTKQRLKDLKNFGITSETTVDAIGINGKMSEINAALGLLQMKHFDTVLDARSRVAGIYQDRFADLRGIALVPPAHQTRRNNAYCPILVGADCPVSRDELYDALKAQGIFTRKYFSPLLSDLPMYRDLPSAQAANLPIAHDVAHRILCLPIYPDLASDEVERIAHAIATIVA